jgi:outer membrane protein assembly factor BamB
MTAMTRAMGPEQHRRGRRGAVVSGAFACALVLVAAACTPIWTTYHKDAGRSGSDLSAPDIVPVQNQWTSPTLDGLVYAEPLVYNNRVYVVTEHDTAYALDESTGKILWHTNVGSPVAANTVTCPLDIDPLGITGTPVIDPATSNIFFVAELANPVRHELFGLNLTTGAINVDVSGDLPGGNAEMDHNRPALALSNGRVYWAYGGTDCGKYHGQVLSTKTDGSDPLIYVVPSKNRGSIWGPSGPAIDPNGNVWVATGDNDGATTPDHSTSVIELSPTLTELGYFTPSDWASLNTSGLEIGSAGPTMLPNGFVFQMGKNAVGYILRQSAPGGIGGAVTQLGVNGCKAEGGNSTSPGWVYPGCLSGPVGLKVDTSVDPPTLTHAWTPTLPSSVYGPSVYGGNTLWVVGFSTGILVALDPTTGAIRQQLSIGHAHNFTTPTIAGNQVIVATDYTVQAFEHVPAATTMGASLSMK